MTDPNDKQHRSILQRIARRAMLEKGLVPDFPPQVLAELDAIHEPATRTDGSTRDLRNLLWCSIDNDDSRDLDQLTLPKPCPTGPPRSWWPLPTLTRSSKTIRPGRSCTAKHHLGLHGCRDISDAAGETLHGSHLAQLCI